MFKINSSDEVMSENGDIVRPDVGAEGFVIKTMSLTQKEVEKLQLNTNFMQLVNINKNSTYFFFGARFEEENA